MWIDYIMQNERPCIAIFCHSLLSDWNHGNAHFLRGIATELLARGHEVRVFEPFDSWSRHNLLRDHGNRALAGFYAAYPSLTSIFYDEAHLNLDEALADVQLVLVHEWNSHALVAKIGRHRARNDYRLLFHDTHHRSVTDRASMAAYDLSNYDGVLAFGEVIRRRYLQESWADNIWVWHEAADTRIFRPLPTTGKQGDLVWIGNWGDEERTAELQEFLFEPIRCLGLKTTIHGVRYPPQAIAALQTARISYENWLPNHEVPSKFAAHSLTVHVPRRPYVQALPGIPTIRVFEALACSIPLISAQWDDCEKLFTPGADFLMARNGREMQSQMKAVLHEPDLADRLKRHGLATIQNHHTCAHRVDELLTIYRQMQNGTVDKTCTLAIEEKAA